MLDLNKLIVYRDIPNSELMFDMVALMNDADVYSETDENRDKLYCCISRLVRLAGEYGFEGNLWQNYLTWLMVNHENVFSTSCEIKGVPEGTVLQLAELDFTIFRQMFLYDFKRLKAVCADGALDMVLSYKRSDNAGKIFNKRIRDHICSLSKTLADSVNTHEFTWFMIQFYQTFGVGKFGLHKAFRVVTDDSGETQIVPINNIAHVKLDDLIGYDAPKKKLIDNTEAFLKGKRANNCLLFGDAGTGKSSSIKAILNKYYDDGLRIIEIYKHQLRNLNDVIAQIKHRNYKFIIYMDDLSFEDFEVEYKYLKAVIEGGLEKKPQNVLIYATSNRRHIVKESFSDRDGWSGDVHKTDTMQEKLSLSARFGVTIYFGSPLKKEYEQIITALAERNGVSMDKEKLLAEANKWALDHGGMSGRTAQQFVDFVLGQQ